MPGDRKCGRSCARFPLAALAVGTERKLARQPVAEITASADGSPIRLKGFNERPSLNWYAEQRIRREQSDDGKNLRLSDQPPTRLPTEGQAGEWTLSDCDKMIRTGE